MTLGTASGNGNGEHAGVEEFPRRRAEDLDYEMARVRASGVFQRALDDGMSTTEAFKLGVDTYRTELGTIAVRRLGIR